MSEVLLYLFGGGVTSGITKPPFPERNEILAVQGYRTYKKTRPPRTLP